MSATSPPLMHRVRATSTGSRFVIGGALLTAAALSGLCGFLWTRQPDPSAVGEPTQSELNTGVVVQVIDGDSVTVLAGRSRLPIRLEGIDCPEGGQPYGNEAERFTRSLLLNRPVELRPKEWDDYGRLVARMWIDNTDVAMMLVEQGFAWHFRRYSDDPHLAAAERRARQARRGLWGESNPTPPWLWRPSLPNSLVPPLTPREDGPFHGNFHSRVAHRSSCRHYNCKACTVTFTSLAAALAAGYRLGACCTSDRQ